jgi:phosphoribosylpyrophosphate synthetase
MDLTNLVTAASSAAFGVADYNIIKGDVENQAVVTIRDLINGFYSGKNSITDIATVLQTEMPIIPICYRTGILFSNEKIENVNNSSYSDIYFSIESYSIKN